MNSVLSRAPGRRGGRRPGWTLMTTLLILAIAASSVLVFTSRVELLKLAVIVALWAAVAAAFVSVIYRRQSDVDQARARDLKLVYDLQLDREISARREYELTVESQLRRELASELRAQAADEVAALRTELSALRTNLEILFDADLSHRPALEQDQRTTVRAYSDWARTGGESSTGPRGAPEAPPFYPGGPATQTAENPIIDVPEVRIPSGGIPMPQSSQPAQPQPAQPQPAQPQPAPPKAADNYRGSHRRGADESQQPPPAAGRWAQPPQPFVAPEPRREPEPPPPPPPAAPQQPPVAPAEAPAPAWQPVGAVGEWLPPGSPGSNWSSADVAAESGRHGAAESRHGRHTGSAAPQQGGRRRAGSRHSAESAGSQTPTTPVEPTVPASPPPAEPAVSVAPPPVEPTTPAEPAAARHSTGGETGDQAGPSTGGQSVAELLARLQPVPTEGRRRRRREE